jgi:hypothetical protein
MPELPLPPVAQQWQSVPEEERYKNRGAVAVLSAPGWHDPQFVQFDAVPRPPAAAFYDYLAGDETGELVGTGDGLAGGMGGKGRGVRGCLP